MIDIRRLRSLPATLACLAGSMVLVNLVFSIAIASLPSSVYAGEMATYYSLVAWERGGRHSLGVPARWGSLPDARGRPHGEFGAKRGCRSRSVTRHDGRALAERGR